MKMAGNVKMQLYLQGTGEEGRGSENRKTDTLGLRRLGRAIPLF